MTTLFKLIIVAAVIYGGYTYWQKHSQPPVEIVATSENGFVPLPPVDGHKTSAVVVLAAENCTMDEARRADLLASDLSRQGVPVVRSHNVGFTFDAGDRAAAQRIQSVMNGQLPIVFVRGRAKANPTLKEVLAEYRGQ